MSRLCFNAPAKLALTRTVTQRYLLYLSVVTLGEPHVAARSDDINLPGSLKLDDCLCSKEAERDKSNSSMLMLSQYREESLKILN